MSVDATRKRVDQPVSTIPDSVDVDSSGVLQRDGQAQSGSGLPLRGGGGGRGGGVAAGVDCGTFVVIGPASAGLYVPEWC